MRAKKFNGNWTVCPHFQQQHRCVGGTTLYDQICWRRWNDAWHIADIILRENEIWNQIDMVILMEFEIKFYRNFFGYFFWQGSATILLHIRPYLYKFLRCDLRFSARLKAVEPQNILLFPFFCALYAHMVHRLSNSVHPLYLSNYILFQTVNFFQ